MTCKWALPGGIPSEAVARRLVLVALVALSSLALGGSARAELSPLFPGATYEKSVQFTPHGPVAIHIVDELPKNAVGKIDKPTLRKLNAQDR